MFEKTKGKLKNAVEKIKKWGEVEPTTPPKLSYDVDVYLEDRIEKSDEQVLVMYDEDRDYSHRYYLHRYNCKREFSDVGQYYYLMLDAPKHAGVDMVQYAIRSLFQTINPSEARPVAIASGNKYKYFGFAYPNLVRNHSNMLINLSDSNSVFAGVIDHGIVTSMMDKLGEVVSVDNPIFKADNFELLKETAFRRWIISELLLNEEVTHNINILVDKNTREISLANDIFYGGYNIRIDDPRLLDKTYVTLPYSVRSSIMHRYPQIFEDLTENINYYLKKQMGTNKSILEETIEKAVKKVAPMLDEEGKMLTDKYISTIIANMKQFVKMYEKAPATHSFE